ncbi:MAG: type II toxin-antitoxin system RelB/DinJ family antitoxin [Sphingobium sp.]|jgi:DNA-damage-inducible protein J|uniref:DNA-damage-inducible protein J n=4 Tax=Sphingobium TaxID=165695 RepID=A0A401J7E2_SPHXE|nr:MULTISPECIES: type II toxin-antitoxin system RelB/DinJ family antitoxin [Sphingobium]MBU0866944.1 type II toxin-antitoxin system RelB/DinJ family antitoxin [Alphaproteobacteria bacterium]OHC91483.1 MAG: damage-inducible protein [Sphingomonadales bacterium GWF1_63_6]EQB33676.1 DNA damage-inducible protein [Sphingobium ummariense RL-3]ETI64175.1 DNA damage-inducible protein [Sphingobium sp. C100]KEZ21165.1 DNA damage-inducible protein [Sphingobium yanoikuyae]|tara:strand:- start:1077 stop:1382 length:306 start_codon:yes stop_codon:yes gene_type:complete
MANNALIQTRIDSDVKDRASAVFERMGLTVSDAVRILLTRTAREGVAPMELLVERQAYDQWFRARVQEALDDDRPDIDDAEVSARFAELRANARKGIKPVQ